jgi:hypothetical protein
MKIRVVSGIVLSALSFPGAVLATERDKTADSGDATEASENPGPARGMNQAISALGSLGYAYSAGTGFGLSGRYQFTVSPDGVLDTPSVHDDFGVEAAVDYQHYNWGYAGYDWSYNEFGLSGSAVWNLWFSERFAAYPRLGLGFAFGTWSSNRNLSHPRGYGGLYLVGGAGVLYELEALTLRAEVSSAALHLGAAISL